MFALLFFFVLTFAPLSGYSQSNETLQQQHQASNQYIQQLHPGLQAINLDSLQQRQASSTQKCSTCPYQQKNKQQNYVYHPETAESLVANNQRIEGLIATIDPNNKEAKLLLSKYKQALQQNLIKLKRLHANAQIAAKKASQH